MVINTSVALSFDDVLLVPKYSTLAKRSHADISSAIVHGISLPVPIVAAPMSCVTEAKMAHAMNEAGGYSIIHRMMSIEDQVKQWWSGPFPEDWWTNRMAAAIGINEGYDRFSALFKAGCRQFCLDIAHAHHNSVEQFIKKLHLEEIFLMAGNVATPEGAVFLAELGVNSIKVGIGPGAACTTREVTGFGVPQLTAIMEVAEAVSDSGISVIADGGIRDSGDIVKALAAGADAVMLGRLLAGSQESPFPGLYFGMASKRINGHHAPEGVEGKVPYTGPVSDTIERLAWGIKSGLSYAGANNLKELRENAEFRLVSPMSLAESKARI